MMVAMAGLLIGSIAVAYYVVAAAILWQSAVHVGAGKPSFSRAIGTLR
jgi:hypothetical protein